MAGEGPNSWFRILSVILSEAKDLARKRAKVAPNAEASVEILRYSSFRSE